MKKVIDRISNIWILLPAVPFYAMVFTYCDNVPKWDDYSLPLEWIINFKDASWADKLHMFVGQYGEHRLIPSKIIYLGYYYVTGTINFRILNIIGDLQLLIVAFVGIHFIKKYSTQWKFLSFIWCLLVFDLNTFENAAMAMNSVGNYGQVAFFMLSLYLYDVNKRIWLCVLVQILCAFSNGNGMLAMLIIPFYCWLKGDKGKFIASSITGIVCVTLNFTFHHSETLPTALPFDLNRSITYFIRMSGAYFDFDNSFWIGILVLSVLVYVIPKRAKDWKSAGLICILAFTIGTMLLTTYFRGNTSDAQFQTSRYLLYPQLMIACIIFFIFQKLNGKKWRIVGVIGALLIFIPTYKHNYLFGELGFQRTQARVLTYKYWFPDPVKAEQISKKSCDEGIYCIEDNR